MKKTLTRVSSSVKSRALEFCQRQFGRELGKTEKVVDTLNPYSNSQNIKLILDLVACRAGVGLALKLLAFLEVDVQNNWKPFKPQISFVP